MPDGTNATQFSTPSPESTVQWPDRAMLQPFTPNMPEKGGETIAELVKQLPPYGKPDCATHLRKDETIDEAIGRVTTSEGMCMMYWMLVQKAQNANQGTAHKKLLSQKG